MSSRRSETRLRGMGECVLRIMVSELRDLAELNDEVEIVNILPGPYMPGYVPGISWDHYPTMVVDRQYAFIHIRSRYAVRRASGAPLMIEDFEKFLETWKSLSKEKK